VVPKVDILKLFDKMTLVGAVELVNEFRYTELSARNKLARLKKEGLIEPAITEKGKWVLSVKGEKRLNYLREVGDGGRTGAGTGGSGG